MAVFDREFTGNIPVILANKMKFDVLPQFFYGKFAGFTTPKGQAVTSAVQPNPIESPVVIQHDLQKKQGDTIKIPLMRHLNKMPKIGNQQLSGFEEKSQINHAVVYIDVVRHANRPQEGIMSTQTTKDYQLIKNARPALLAHYAQVNEFLGAAYAMYYGFSYNILFSDRFANSNLSPVSHPNIYVAGQGKVAGTPGTAAYETNVANAIGAVTSGNVFNTAFLSALKTYPQIKRIRPLIMKDGNPLRLIAAHPYQIHSLEQDSAFQTAAASAWAQAYAKDNPMLVGAKYYWAGFMIFETETAVWSADVSNGEPVFGKKNPQAVDEVLDYDGAEKFAAVIFGQNALFKAMGDRIRFIQEVKDYDEILGIAYRSVEGYSRGDFWNYDDGTLGEHLINHGSALAITYAAKPSL